MNISETYFNVQIIFRYVFRNMEASKYMND